MKARPHRSPISGGPFVCMLIGALAGPVAVSGQQPVDSLRTELARLAALVDSLSREVARLRASGDSEGAGDALARLRAAAATAAAAGGEAARPIEQEEFVGRERSLQALNPEISLNADVMAHLDPDDVGSDPFFWREFEISLRSALDPFSRAAIFISRHGDGPEILPFGGGEEEDDAHGGGGFDVEEGYVEWVSLPGGIGLKLGKFFQRFGTLNRWHAHALSFQSRSLPHIALLGEEALSQSGASVSWLAPFGGGSAGTYEATVEVTRSENETLFGEARRATVLAHVNGFWQLTGSTDLELGATWLNGPFQNEVESFDRNAYNAEFAFNWIPPSRSRRTGLTLRGGYMLLDGLGAEAQPGGLPVPPGEDRGSAGGFWSMADLRLSPSWLMGARFDRVQDPTNPDVTQWLVSPTVTWWQSEFVRLRAEYDFLSGIEGGDGTGMFIVQATFAMGPHKHSTY